MTPSGARVGTEISLFATRSGTVRGGHTITAAHAGRKHQDEHNRRRSGRAGCMFGDDPCYLHLSFRHPGGDTMKEMTLLITRATMFDLAVLGVVIITWTIIGSVVIGLLCVAAATTMAAIVKLVDSERHVLGFLGWIAIVSVGLIIITMLTRSALAQQVYTTVPVRPAPTEHKILPPPEYDYVYEGDLTIVKDRRGATDPLQCRQSKHARMLDTRIRYKKLRDHHGRGRGDAPARLDDGPAAAPRDGALQRLDAGTRGPTGCIFGRLALGASKPTD